MANSHTGGIAKGIIFGGQVIDLANITEMEVKVLKTQGLVPTAGGDQREGRWFSGPEYPLTKEKRMFKIDYAHLRGDYDLVEEICSGPGPYDLVTWKRIHPQYAGNGSRVAFKLYHQIATYAYTPPAEFPAERFAVEVRVGTLGSTTDLTVLEKSQAAYDAGTPGASEVWFITDGVDFKVGTAPTAGQRLFVRMVPIYSVFEAPESERDYPNGSTIREPRSLELVEA